MAEVTAEQVRLTELDGREIAKSVFHVKWDAVAAEKGGYEDFMLKEIHEQPRALRETLAGKLDRDNLRVVLPELRSEAGGPGRDTGKSSLSPAARPTMPAWSASTSSKDCCASRSRWIWPPSSGTGTP